MTSKLLGSSRVVAYLPSLREAVRHFRAFSSYDERSPRTQFVEVGSTTQSDSRGKGDNIFILTKSKTVWPDPNLGPFGPQDQRFPMPGLVGPSQQLATSSDKPETRPSDQPEILTEPSKTAKQFSMIQEYLEQAHSENAAESMYDHEQAMPAPSSVLECVAQDCPQLIRKDFQDLFPDRNITDCPLTVITISHHTKQDMSGWSSSVEEEREQLLDHFVSGATDICSALKEAGYWADFIDPSSGRPFLGEYTNSTLFETDERLRSFGFDIDDLGCCKVIKHHIWGTHAYVGCLFTDAPVDHPVLLAMNVRQNAPQ